MLVPFADDSWLLDWRPLSLRVQGCNASIPVRCPGRLQQSTLRIWNASRKERERERQRHGIVTQVNARSSPLEHCVRCPHYCYRMCCCWDRKRPVKKHSPRLTGSCMWKSLCPLPLQSFCHFCLFFDFVFSQVRWGRTVRDVDSSSCPSGEQNFWQKCHLLAHMFGSRCA